MGDGVWGVGVEWHAHLGYKLAPHPAPAQHNVASVNSSIIFSRQEGRNFIVGFYSSIGNYFVRGLFVPKKGKNELMDVDLHMCTFVCPFDICMYARRANSSNILSVHSFDRLSTRPSAQPITTVWTDDRVIILYIYKLLHLFIQMYKSLLYVHSICPFERSLNISICAYKSVHLAPVNDA